MVIKARTKIRVTNTRTSKTRNKTRRTKTRTSKPRSLPMGIRALMILMVRIMMLSVKEKIDKIYREGNNAWIYT